MFNGNLKNSLSFLPEYLNGCLLVDRRWLFLGFNSNRKAMIRKVMARETRKEEKEVINNYILPFNSLQVTNWTDVM